MNKKHQYDLKNELAVAVLAQIQSTVHDHKNELNQKHNQERVRNLVLLNGTDDA